MLTVNAQTTGSVAIFRCQGRIVSADQNTFFRNAVLLQANCSTLVLDLAEVGSIDAGGFGALLGLQAWTRSNGIQLKIVNVPWTIQQVLEVTNLDRVFEIYSEKELVDLLHGAVAMATPSRPSLDQPKIEEDREVSATVWCDS
jgi:anti-sigma B factor antagonist